VSQAVADAVCKAGLVDGNIVRTVSLAEGARLLTGGVEQVAELGFASTCKTRGEVAKRLDWHPSAGIEAWEQGFVEEVDALRSKL
jgi:hypothetical protein